MKEWGCIDRELIDHTNCPYCEQVDMKKLKRGLRFLTVILIVLIIMICVGNLAVAEHTAHTFVGGISSRADSDVNLALASGSYIYDPMMLTVGADHNCNYSVYVNGTLYREGEIDILTRGFIDIRVNFENAGEQPFSVKVGMDTYNYSIRVLKRSFEQLVTEDVLDTMPMDRYVFNDILKAYGASIVGMVVALVIAYMFKINKIRREPRRLL